MLDPTALAEVSMDTPILEPAPEAQRAPSVSNNTTTTNYDFLVVWQDRRRSLNLTYDVFGTYVSRTGVLQTPGWV